MPHPRATRDEHHEQCLQVYELKCEQPELSCVKIAEKLDLNKATVSYWLRYDRFVPYIDEIALERALEGDRACFEGLTLWERDLFYDALQRRRLSMRRKAWEEWVRNFAQCIGLNDGGQIGDSLYKRYGAGFKHRPLQLRVVRPQRGTVLVRRKDRYGRRNFI